MDTAPDGQLGPLPLMIIAAGPMYTDEVVSTLHKRSDGAYDDRMTLVFKARMTGQKQ
jgi:hypothetical protein